MKKAIFLSMGFIFFLILRVSYAEIIWQEDFNEYTKDWICCIADCANTPGIPPGFSQFNSNAMGGNYGNCNSQITTDAHHGTPGANKRGFRIYLEEDVFPTGENVLSKNLGASYKHFFLRWYQREDFINYTHFQKLFRIWTSSTDEIIPEWQVYNGHVCMNIYDSATASNHFITGYQLDQEYTPNTWVCYEIEIDLTNKRAEFWVNGVSKGVLTNQGWRDSWQVRYIYVGGNQYGHPWSAPVEHHIDYDDIVVSTSYVGPDTKTLPDTEPDTEPPNPPVGLELRIEQ